MQVEQIIRPSAILSEANAVRIVAALTRLDVARGGVWNASSALWQRYDRPWDGPLGMRGSAQLLGSIAVMYDRPARHQITIYKVSLTERGVACGLTVESMCDEALNWIGLTLASCPRDELAAPPKPDPFRRPALLPA